MTCRMLGSWRNERNLLFRDDSDKNRFLARLEQSVLDFDIRLYLYCLMTNHFHLLVETPQGNLSKFMQSLNTGYTVYFNRRHRRHGHLLDGRYKAELVAGDEYLLKLSRYIHLNPVEVASWKNRPLKERIQRLRSYTWSSYRVYIGKAKAAGLVDMSPVLSLVEVFGKGGPRGYRDYVEFGLAHSDVELKEILKVASRGIGDLDFRNKIERLRNRIVTKHRKPEDVSFRRDGQLLPLDNILSEVAEFLKVSPDALAKKQRGSLLRPITARMLQRFGGCSQREIAKIFGLTTGAAVSAQLKRIQELEQNDRKTRRKLARLEERLRNRKDTKQPVAE